MKTIFIILLSLIGLTFTAIVTLWGLNKCNPSLVPAIYVSYAAIAWGAEVIIFLFFGLISLILDLDI